MIAKKVKNVELREYVDDYDILIVDNIDIYDENGKLLLKFRKRVINNTAGIFDELYKFAQNESKDRGVASGSPIGATTGNKNGVKSNIMGYFDTWTVGQKAVFKEYNIKPPKNRITSFTYKNPDKWSKVVPLIEQIDKQYKELCPEYHSKQYEKAKRTRFRIADTAFSTVTVNLDFRTASHTDSGDFPEGFGNLIVLEKGEYEGAYTMFPEYGIAVDVREGDFLAMDVHRLHCNTKKIGDGHRMSLVSYLRNGLSSQ